MEFTVTNNTPAFSEATGRADRGILKIIDSANVPPNTFYVGIAMSEKGIYLEAAAPGKHVFMPPSFCVCAVDQVKEGDVLDIQDTTQTAELHYPPNVYNNNNNTQNAAVAPRPHAPTGVGGAA